MAASILIAGNHALHRTITTLLSEMTNLAVEMVTSAADADAIISAQQPDILILSADDHQMLHLSQRLRSQTHLSWIYQIFVGELWQPSDQSPPLSASITTIAATEALNNGADSYLVLSKDLDVTVPETYLIEQNLFCAQIQAGLRRVHKARELVRTNDLLSAIALSDPLTELNNRRAFEWELPRQVQSARTRLTPVSVLMLDIDYFKSINDRYGHLVGDQALQMVSRRLRHHLRCYDTPFRYGGEEFSIILNNTTLQEATQIGQRICHLIAEQPFLIAPSLELAITISIGGASLSSDDDDQGVSLLQRADQNLLKAKANGRNQFVSDETETVEAISQEHVASPPEKMIAVKHRKDVEQKDMKQKLDFEQKQGAIL